MFVKTLHFQRSEKQVTFNELEKGNNHDVIFSTWGHEYPACF